MASENSQLVHAKTCKENLHRNLHRRVHSRGVFPATFNMRNRGNTLREAIHFSANFPDRVQAELQYGVLIPTMLLRFILGVIPSYGLLLRSFSPRSSAFQTSSGYRFICSGRDMPLLSQSPEIDVECSETGDPTSASQIARHANRSLNILECLHHDCRLPLIRKDLAFEIRPLREETQRWRALESSYMNASLIIWVGCHLDLVSVLYSTRMPK